MAFPAPGGELCRTERLILRRFTLEDVPAYFEMMNQPRIEATLVPGPKSPQQAAREIATVEGHWALSGMSFCAVAEKATGLLVGRVGPWFPYGWPAPEVGWTIHPRRHRRGYAVEAARAAGRWLLGERPDLDRLIHLISPGNTGSQNTARKLGGAKTGEVFIHPEAGSLDIWATPRAALF